MPRRVVKLDLKRPFMKFMGKDGVVRQVSPTVDSLLRVRSRKIEAKKNRRVIIRLKREF